MALGILLRENQVTAALIDAATRDSNILSLEVGKEFPDALEAFVKQRAGDEKVTVGLELYRTPVDVFPEFMHFLHGVSKFGSAGFTLSQDKRKALIGDIPETMKWAAHGQTEVRLIFPGMARAFHWFEVGREPTEAECAATVATICASIGRYRYCRSVGVVQSSADVALFLEHPPERGSGVLSGGDWYHAIPIAATKIGASRGDVFLQYELGKKHYEYLNEINALKMGLLHTCREYSFKLYCCRLEGEEGEIFNRIINRGVEPIPDEYLVWGPRPT